VKVDLNSDLTESFGAWTMSDDTAMLDMETAGDIGRGFHVERIRVEQEGTRQSIDQRRRPHRQAGRADPNPTG
jgi:lactam utilization protein B